MIDLHKMSLFCTSRCNLNCVECIMGPLKTNNPNYELSIADLQQLLKISEASGYTFFFTLSGGEPLLWNNLKEGVEALRNSKVCLGIEIFTNAINIKSLTKEAIEKVDEIRISKYNYNIKNIAILQDLYHEKIKIVDRTQFWENPISPVPNSLPAECLYDKCWYYNKRIYACAHSQSLIYKTNLNVQLYRNLEIGFLDNLEEIKINQGPAVCTVCISNMKVRKQVQKISNIGQHDPRISHL